jgi:Helix-turn-helix
MAVRGPTKINLTVERINRGLSIRGLSLATGVHQATIKRAEETGEPITPRTAFKLASFYGYNVSNIWDVGGDGPPPNARNGGTPDRRDPPSPRRTIRP